MYASGAIFKQSPSQSAPKLLSSHPSERARID
jgi:hypothetical protein